MSPPAASEVLLTVAGVPVRPKLHEVGAGTGECLVVVDQAEVRAGAFAAVSCTGVWSWGAADRMRGNTEKLSFITVLTVFTSNQAPLSESHF